MESDEQVDSGVMCLVCGLPVFVESNVLCEGCSKMNWNLEMKDIIGWAKKPEKPIP